MRIVILGAGSLAVMAARQLLERRNEVVIIERDRARIDEIAEELDCGYLQGDGSKPAILREANPGSSELLLCLSDDDQDNIIAGLVGRELGFERVVVRIEDPEYEHICMELGLENTIVPDRTIARFLVDLAEDNDPLEISSVMKAGVRFFQFVAREEHAVPAGDLDLPKNTRAVIAYRDGEYLPLDADTELRAGDEVVLVTHRSRIEGLRRALEPDDS